MANKIYDFLPAHLQNKELETIFEATLERVFSKGNVEKTRAYVGRKEKGVYKKDDAYLSYPTFSYSRTNYSLEPVFSNVSINENIFYDDLINSLYNHGSLTNDHRRLFQCDRNTVNLPIDIDKFVNWSSYYWVSPLFAPNENINGSDIRSYVTIDRMETPNNWWSFNNSWYHYDDIKHLIDETNRNELHQAQRPIIEFDNRLSLDDESLNKAFDSVEITEPKFLIFDSENNYITSAKIFSYVTGDYAYDSELGLYAKLSVGDYASEYNYTIDIDVDVFYNVDTVGLANIYIPTEFNYRNYRQEVSENAISSIELLHEPIDTNSVDVYFDGIKQYGNYSIVNDIVVFDNTVEDKFVYVDYCTKNEVTIEGAGNYQRIDPAIEFNPDNSYHTNVELTYSVLFEHFIRIMETVPGMDVNPIGHSPLRNLGDNSDKLRFNNYGSVMVRTNTDTKFGYFCVTKDDYNPFDAIETLSSAYSSYKNKFVTRVREILSEAGSDSKTDSEILEQAITNIIALQGRPLMFKDINMINFGKEYAHYEEQPVDVVIGSSEQFTPEFSKPVVDEYDIYVYVNGKLQVLRTDYVMSIGNTTINFTNGYVGQVGDEITVRYYINSEDVYIPPSSTKLGLNPAYVPIIVTDNEYENSVDFIVGHDGSKTPVWGDRTDSILLEFEIRCYNNVQDKSFNYIDYEHYGPFRWADDSYTLNEKNYIMYPFFKKWMLKNNVDSLENVSYDPNNWKTWNYKFVNDITPGNWRGMYRYVYGTDNLLNEPWLVLGVASKPANFDLFYGTDYTTEQFWTDILNDAGKTAPIPVDASGNLRTPEDLFFGGNLSTDDISNMNLDWEFGDGSPVEFAWLRSSEFPFIAFLQMMIEHPFEVLDRYNSQVKNVIALYNKFKGLDTDTILADLENYEFRLGSKLGGFVNNLKLYAENTSIGNSNFTEIPRDNFDLLVHKGEPNRSEFFSAIVIEKVSIDTPHPIYDINDILSYNKGDIVLNSNDKKYYRRKVETPTQKEIDQTINFDYNAWTLISQPKTRSFGYRIHGYDDFNPVFYALDWDKTSEAKLYATEGDPLSINDWISGVGYKNSEYSIYNGQVYVCLEQHTSSTIFDNDFKYWKQLSSRPRTNQVFANGYSKVQNDQVKVFNYGDILTSLDDVAHLMVGYQEYLKLVGWNFTDVDSEDSSIIDYETLLLKFLDWSAETHQPGEFITLSPMIITGEFSAPYGVASVTKETHQNYYRVVDNMGRLIPDTAIKFYTDGEVLRWESSVPVYGMKIDISDFEHAIIVDREDSYGDTIYDPLMHNRNLRLIIDCNRTTDWDGTMTTEGYLLYGNTMVPNFETIIEDTRNYRDTLVDQNLEVVNLLKSNQYGSATRTYLDNHKVEPESQLEFYKGFLAAKGRKDSIDRLINKNSNINKVEQFGVWAHKYAEFGKTNNTIHANATVNVKDMKSNPHLIDFGDVEKRFVKTSEPYTANFKTTGYVDSSLVNYTVSGESALETLDNTLIFEGDLAWIQFDPERDWDVKRLGEIAEIDYVRETSDGQLCVALTNSIDTTDTVFLRINDSNIDPVINGYYYLIEEGTRDISGLTVYEYLVFETNYEPVSIEIDTTTSDSIYVPTSNNIGVEAIGTISFPQFLSGDTLLINGTSYIYADAATTGYISIVGSDTATDPFVQPGDTMRVAVYSSATTIENANTNITFTGTVADTTNPVTSVYGDIIVIDGTPISIDYSSTQSITEVSIATESTVISNGKTVIVDGNTVAFANIEILGTIVSPTITSTKALNVNGTNITFTVADPLTPLTAQDIVDTINASSTGLSATLNVDDKIDVVFSGMILEMSGTAIQDIGLGTENTLRISKLQNVALELNVITGITSYVDATGHLVIGSSLSQMTLSGTALTSLGFEAGTYESTTDPNKTSIVNQINSSGIPNVSASATSVGVRITKNGSVLTVTEDPSTPGAMTRLGFTTSLVEVDALDLIVEQLNSVIFENDTNIGTALATVDRRIKILSPQFSIVLSDVSGNTLADLGLVAGTYSNTGGNIQPVYTFASIINSVSTDVRVTVTSDGRMVFTSDAPTLTFQGTSSSMLTKVGLRTEYTSITSNSNFKIMRWSSVRYSPEFNNVDFDDWYRDLGLNSQTTLWVDEYTNGKWAVLNRSDVGFLSVIATQSSRVDSTKMNRLIAKDESDTFKTYYVYDPLYGRLPGELLKNINYITWENPAKYDSVTSSDVWLDDHVGEVWWDTANVRYYRYHDYGDNLGNIDVSYVRKFWGKLVPGSEIVVKKWTTSQVLPSTITDYNTYTYYDIVSNALVTKYYYWAETEQRTGNEITISDISAMISSPIGTNYFIPVTDNSIIVTNKANTFVGKTVDFELRYNITSDTTELHTEWELFNDDINSNHAGYAKTQIINDLTLREVQSSVVFEIDDAVISDPTYVTYEHQMFEDCTIENTVVSVNSEFVLPNNIVFDNGIMTVINDGYLIGDVVRVYKLETLQPMLIRNTNTARSNFASIVNDIMSHKNIDAFAPQWREYVSVGYAVNLHDWVLNDDFQNTDDYEYTSNSYNIDMIDMYNNGVNSFKITIDQNGVYDSYYYPVNGELRLVKRSNSAINLSFEDMVYPINSYDTYFDNVVAVQIIEFINMIEDNGGDEIMKQIVIGMVDYMFTERHDHEISIFKTSYIDVNFTYRPLAQHAIYQRDSYQDMLDYINETKPYHVKVRNVKSKYTLEENITSDVSEERHIEITMDFGNNSRYKLDVLSGDGSENVADATSGVDITTIYDAGKLLRNDVTLTSEPDGFDTGFIDAYANDSVVFKEVNWTDETRSTLDTMKFYVYDQFGRGYIVHIGKMDTVNYVDGNKIVVNDETLFRAAKSKTKRLIALENGNSLEFMMYDRLSGAELNISDRGLYTGLYGNFSNGDAIFVVDHIETITAGN